MTLRADLIDALTDEMASQGLTQTEVADRLGINKSGLSRPLNGALTLPMAERIAAAIGVRISFDLEAD